MVHHYGGHKFSFKRQIEFLNGMGVDVYTFDLPYSDMRKMRKWPVSSKGAALRHAWADGISRVLEAVSGPKFVYSFSSPSAAALDAMARRNFHDIRGWICDGGPFTDIVTGITNLVHSEIFMGRPFKSPRLHELFSKIVGRGLAWIWGGANFDKDMRELLMKVPKDFPIISFRAENDILVYPKMIDDFFALAGTPIQPVLLHRSEHLQGFKQQPERYKAFLQDYVQRYATHLVNDR